MRIENVLLKLNPRLHNAADVAEAMEATLPGAIADRDECLAMFLAQGAHETTGFTHFHEVWGPTPAQERYEGRVDLGNAHPGDGFLFRGRGIFQLTGRRNYAHYGALLGVDLEAHPDMAAELVTSCEVAVLYWTLHGLSAFVTAGQLDEVTHRINGGYNGLEDRNAKYRIALLELRAA